MKVSSSVVVLGAGASRGARVAGTRTPPLDSDFLDAASRMFSHLHARGPNAARVKAWLSFKTHLRRAGVRFEDVKHWRLEQLSTFLEARANLKGLQLNVGRPKDHAQALQALRVVVCHVLRSSGGEQACSLHRLLFEAVRPKAVISFNYDLIADQTLLDLGRLDWSKTAYRGGATARVPSVEGGSYYRQVRASPLNGAVPLVKLHGSIHWERMSRQDGYRLSGVRLPESGRRTFEILWVPDDPYLIPPVASKIEIKEGALRKHWYAALDYLHDARSWIIWGYSFPQTDTVSQVLFRTAIAKNKKPKPVIVVNPDATAAQRVIEVCRKVTVQHYVSLEALLLDWEVLTMGE